MLEGFIIEINSEFLSEEKLDFNLNCLFLVFVVEFILMFIKEFIISDDKKMKSEESSRSGLEVVFNIIEDI